MNAIFSNTKTVKMAADYIAQGLNDDAALQQMVSTLKQQPNNEYSDSTLNILSALAICQAKSDNNAIYADLSHSTSGAIIVIHAGKLQMFSVTSIIENTAPLLSY